MAVFLVLLAFDWISRSDDGQPHRLPPGFGAIPEDGDLKLLSQLKLCKF